VSWCRARTVVVPRHGGAAPAPWCRAVEVSRHGATPSRSCGVVSSRSRARAVEELHPRGGGRREEQSHASMNGRERVVADAVNLGEMEMNERVTLRERESTWEK
jgi:hypothetical protein